MDSDPIVINFNLIMDKLVSNNFTNPKVKIVLLYTFLDPIDHEGLDKNIHPVATW